MKKAYNPNWIRNTEIQRKATDWLSKNLIAKTQFESVKSEFPEHFHRPNFFVKAGLFLFVLIACSFFLGLISLFLNDNIKNPSFSVVSLLCAVFFIFFLEYHIKSMRLFHSGIDNALLYLIIILTVTPIFLEFESLELWQYALVLFIVLAFAAFRYADLLTAAGAFTALFVALANFLVKFSAGTLLLPFAVMLLAACIYFPVSKNRSIYYANCCKLIKLLSLATFYLGGNYLIVREGNALLNNPGATVSGQIPFAPIFYLLTTMVPMAYIWFGIRKKDWVLLNTGLLALFFSVYTFTYYFSSFTGPQEIFLSGFCLLLFSGFAIRYLHTPKYGLSDEPEERNVPDELKSILIAQALGQDPETKGIEFGGGNFGGGGAGEVY